MLARPRRAHPHVGASGAPRSAAPAIVFVVASLALFMSAVDSTIVSTGLPTIGHALHVPLNWASWTMTAYQLGLVVAMPVAGRLSDFLGRKRVFIVAACVFTLSSLACGFAPGIGTLIVFRVIQALGGGAFVPAATGIVSSVYGERRDEALGLFSSVFPLGALVGPILGGLLLSAFSWRSIFLVNVPVGVLFTVLALRFLPRTPPVGGTLDLTGTALLGAAVLAAMLGVTHLGDPLAPADSIATLGPLAVSAVAAGAFVWHCQRAREPLVSVILLRERSFGAMTGINFVWGACAIGFGSLVPVFAEERFHLSPLSAGTLLTARALGEIGIAALASLLIRRTGYRLPMVVGFLLISGGLVMIALPPMGVGAAFWLGIGAAVTGIGTGASAPAANNATLQLSPEDIGTVAGIRGAARQAGAIFAVALTTSLMARSDAHVAILARCFPALAVLLVLVTPLVLAVPDRDAALASA